MNSSPRVSAQEPGGRGAGAGEVDGEFVVLKGSTARKAGIAARTGYRALREQLVADGKLVDSADPALLVFAEDIAFNSPSAAAAVVANNELLTAFLIDRSPS